MPSLVKLAILSLAMFGGAAVAQDQIENGTGAVAITSVAGTTGISATATTTAPAATSAPATTFPPATIANDPYSAATRTSTVPLVNEFGTTNHVINRDVFALVEAQSQGYTGKVLPTGFYGNGATWNAAETPYDGVSPFVAPNPAYNSNYNSNYQFSVHGYIYNADGTLKGTAPPGTLVITPVTTSSTVTRRLRRRVL
jgi:hypothetical protein